MRVREMYATNTCWLWVSIMGLLPSFLSLFPLNLSPSPSPSPPLPSPFPSSSPSPPPPISPSLTSELILKGYLFKKGQIKVTVFKLLQVRSLTMWYIGLEYDWSVAAKVVNYCQFTRTCYHHLCTQCTPLLSSVAFNCQRRS